MNIAPSRHFSKLVRDYLTSFADAPIHDFFPYPPFERGNALKKLAQALTERASGEKAKQNREQLIAELRKQQTTSHPQIEKHLELLAKPTTLAVVTGQQTGILGGPLYTLYKALTAVALARELDTVLDGYNVVPIFWQETEDHDLDEASHYGIFDQGGNYIDVAYAFKDEDARKQVGGLKLDHTAIQTFFETLEQSLQKTEFTEQVLADFKQHYSAGTTFAAAQASFLTSLTASEGLIILNANAPAIKSIGKELFKKEIGSAGELQNAIRTQTENLVATYTAQVDPSEVNLFIIDNGKRYKLEKDNDGFRYDESHISAEALATLIDTTPERISPNVVMRPLFQDTVLPTIAYVAGPGEIAYFAQLRSAYTWAGIPMPLISPRFSATILEEKTKKNLSKAGISIEEMIEDGPQVIQRATASADEAVIASRFEEVTKVVEREVESLRTVVVKTDGSLDGALTGLKGKVLTPIKDLAAKTLAAERKKTSTVRSQLERSLASVLPQGVLQERKLGILYYANKYGPGFIDGLKRSILRSKLSAEHILLEDVAEVANLAELPYAKSR